MPPTPKTPLMQLGKLTPKGLFKVLGWLVAVLMLLLNLYQLYDTKTLENQLQEAEKQISNAQGELDKARRYIDTMERDLESFETKDAKVNTEIDSLIGKWKADLEGMKAVISDQLQSINQKRSSAQ